MDDAALLMACAESGLVPVAFDRATLPWHAGQVFRAGESHGGLILFRRTVRSTNYGEQARLLTEFWFKRMWPVGLKSSASRPVEVFSSAL